MKIDLDDLEKRLDCDMHCNQDVYDLITELKAARKVVEVAREFNDVCSHGIYVNEKLSHAIFDYDEIINDKRT